MTNIYFTITGHYSGERWLVNMFDGGVALIEPRFWSIGKVTGLSYAGAAGKYYSSKWPTYLAWRVKLRIWRIETRWERKARRHARMLDLADRHGGKPSHHQQPPAR